MVKLMAGARHTSLAPRCLRVVDSRGRHMLEEDDRRWCTGALVSIAWVDQLHADLPMFRCQVPVRPRKPFRRSAKAFKPSVSSGHFAHVHSYFCHLISLGLAALQGVMCLDYVAFSSVLMDILVWPWFPLGGSRLEFPFNTLAAGQLKVVPRCIWKLLVYRVSSTFSCLLSILRYR